MNPSEGLYKSPVTGDSLSLDEAIEKGLIFGELLSSRTKRTLLPPIEEEVSATFTEKRSYTITHAKDTKSGKFKDTKSGTMKVVCAKLLFWYECLTSRITYYNG